MRQCMWFDNALLVFLSAVLTVAVGMGCGQRNLKSDTKNAVAEVQDRFFDSDGVRIRYVVNGSEGAEPVIFINGFPERLVVWSEVITSTPLKGYRLIRFDPRGIGLSDKPHGQKDYGQKMVEDVVRLLDHLKIKKAHVVGYSMGAWIALNLVNRYPERLITATLGGGAGLHRAQAVRQQIIANAIEGKDISAAVRNLTFPDGAALSEEEMKETERVLQDVARQYARDLDPMAVAPMMRGFVELVIADEELDYNRTPTLAIYSNENDAGRPLAGAITTFAKRMPSVSLVQIRDANHGNARSKPQFVEALAEFFSKRAAK